MKNKRLPNPQSVNGVDPENTLNRTFPAATKVIRANEPDKATLCYEKLSAAADERQFGFPRSDIERMMRHHSVDRETAIKLLKQGRPLPRRGSGLLTKRN